MTCETSGASGVTEPLSNLNYFSLDHTMGFLCRPEGATKVVKGNAMPHERERDFKFQTKNFMVHRTLLSLTI